MSLQIAAFDIGVCHDMVQQAFNIGYQTQKLEIRTLIKTMHPGVPDIIAVYSKVCPEYGEHCITEGGQHGHFVRLELLTDEYPIGSFDGCHLDELTPEGKWAREDDCLGCVLYNQLSAIYDPFILAMPIKKENNHDSD